MTQRPAHDHEPPAVVSTVAMACALVGFFQGLVVPPVGATTHIVIGIVFAAVGAAAGLRTALVTGRRRRSGVWGRVAVVLGVVAIGMLVYQALVFLTDGTVPPPFWAPYRR